MEGALHRLIVQIGEAASAAFRDSVRLVTFIGETITEFASALCKPRRIDRIHIIHRQNMLHRTTTSLITSHFPYRYRISSAPITPKNRHGARQKDASFPSRASR